MKISSELKSIIESSSFEVLNGEYVYAKVSGQPSLNDAFFISRDSKETTVCFEANKESKFQIIEKNEKLRKLIEMKPSKPFVAVGFIASLTSAIAEAGCNVLVISTYSSDYILVTLEHFEKAKQALVDIGLKEDL